MNQRYINNCLFVVLLFVAQAACGQNIWINSEADWPRSPAAEPGECLTDNTVTNPETGEQEPACTLRAAIETANAFNPQGLSPQGQITARIRFEPWINLNAGNATLIRPGTPLPMIQYPIHLDGVSHRNFDADQGWASLMISGALLDDPTTDNGLVFGPGSSGSIVDAITLINFPGAGIVISSNSVSVRRSRLGVNFNGSSTSFPNGVGLLISGNNNLIGYQPVPPGTLVEGEALFPNVIAGNTLAGIDIVSGQGNRVFGNHIGVNNQGFHGPDSGEVGVRVTGGASATRIGAFDLTDPAEPLLAGNVIASHSLAQILLQSADSVIVCNHLGFNKNGDQTLAPGSHGILVGSAATGNQIGDTDCPNRIHGIQSGIQIGNASQTAGDAQVVSGNWISIGVDGQAPDVLTQDGIRVMSGEGHILQYNRIGHASVGINLGSADSLVSFNRIGTGDNAGDHAETYPLTESGLRIDGQDHTITSNVIGNAGVGIRFRPNASGNTLTRNLIGLASGAVPLPNQGPGIYLDGSTNTVGGATSSSTNQIGFNQGPGVIVDGDNQRIWRNLIGVQANGQAIGNAGFGVVVLDSATLTQIGGDPDRANHIAGNGGGIRLNASAQVVFNRIGEAPNGAVLPNQGAGIEIGPGFNSSVIEYNRIAHNTSHGVNFDPAAGQRHRLLNNEIYNNLGKGIDLGPGGRDQDPDDADTGPNNLQNFPRLRPRLSGYNPDSGQLEVVFRVDSSPDHSLYPIGVQFYLSDPADDHAQGLAYLGTVLYEESDAQSYVNATVTVPPAWSLDEDDPFVAIATTADGNSSEFSNPFGMPPELVIGGVIENLQGTLTLSNPLYNDTTSVNGTGTVNFTMTEKLYPEESFNVQITGLPNNQSCQLQNGSGVIGDEDHLDIVIVCDDPVDQIFSDRFESLAKD